MKVFVTGGLGFVGTQLSIRLLEQGHEVTVVDRAPRPAPQTPPQVVYLSADTTAPGDWQQSVAGQDAVINLAGATIFQRWNATTKKAIYDSRILTTRNLVQAMDHRSGALLCSTSAVGYYGFRGDEELSEEADPGDDFLARVCVDWEKETKRAADRGARVVLTRFGLVLGKTGGAMGQMTPLFNAFIGGPLGSGQQWFSWIHIQDLLASFMFVFNEEKISGPVNFCAPNPVRNRELARELGRALSRPSFIPTPGFALRVLLGEFGSVLLKGQRAVPARLLEYGFAFTFPTLPEALRDLVGK